MKDGRARLAQKLTAPQTTLFAKRHTNALMLPHCNRSIILCCPRSLSLLGCFSLSFHSNL